MLTKAVSPGCLLTIPFHFPPDIRLSNPPLVEAWLEIQWQLEPVQPPQVMRDAGFKFALGWFFAEVRERFPFKVDLPASEAPEDLLPHVVRYQFRPGKHQWPVIQFGPGIATVNFVGSYQWEDFAELTDYLRTNLIEAYASADASVTGKAAILKYRNAEPFDYDEEDVLQFMSDKLNTRLELPPQIPGSVSEDRLVNTVDLKLDFKLQTPPGVGRIWFATGEQRQTNEKQLLWEINVISQNENCPSLDSADDFRNWLNAAHDVNHEWFFSLIEGTLREQYS